MNLQLISLFITICCCCLGLATGSSTPNSPQKRMEEYWKRVSYFMMVTDPKILFVTKAQIEAAKKLRAQGDKRAEALLTATVHQDTGQIIPLPFRLSAFVPTNMAIVLGMLRARSPQSIIAWQVINQSLNTGVNWANGNKSNQDADSTTALLMSYFASVGASCSVAMGLNHIARNRQSRMLRAAVPITAVTAANWLNIGLIRLREMQDGIEVREAGSGRMIGRSKVAARDAIIQTAITRTATALPVLALPPLIMSMVDKTFLKGRPALYQAVYLMTIGMCLRYALPPAVAAFPQQATMSINRLERELRETVGSGETHVVFNKGL